MRKKIVAGNWKMNKLYREAVDLTDDIINLINEGDLTPNPSPKGEGRRGEVTKILIPPFPYLRKVSQRCKTHGLFTGAQNCASEEAGAYTGEVSAAMLKSVGASYIIIGHSERRSYFHETHAELKKKVDIALNQNLTPIFCIGETREMRQAHQHFAVVEAQIKDSLFHLHAPEFATLVLAYEPVWAIGTGVTATNAQVEEMHRFIRHTIETKYGKETAQAVSILYGGSCTPKNASEIFSCADVDGGLIGGASLTAKDFVTIIHSFSK